ncbi:MAG: hypothetical protein FJ303_00405 [Planctomycetes bacterium]|nr:hypothetical protein [Planctomycetota bacterium]
MVRAIVTAWRLLVAFATILVAAPSLFGGDAPSARKEPVYSGVTELLAPDPTAPRVTSGIVEFHDANIVGIPLARPRHRIRTIGQLVLDAHSVMDTTEGPLGYAGSSGIMPRDVQTEVYTIPMEDRWRVPFPDWDRYGKGHPVNDDYPYVRGRWWDPFNQNVLKGDYPILGQNIFLEVTGTTQIFLEPRQTPIATTPFESTSNPNSPDFFGRPGQLFYTQNFFLSLDLFHGDTAFRPVDWRIKVTPAFNVNYLAVNELAVVSPDVRKGTTRGRSYMALQEWFVESKLADIGPNYDFVSMRVGSQPFTSDFRGFIFSDINRGVRLFGNNFSNRDQFNLVYFNMQEKDTNSFLNTFRDRHQQVVVANYYRQDFIFPGYTAQLSVHYNHDSPTMKFDNNGFLVRPDPVGVFQPHTVDVVYLGWAGDGHIGRLNISHAFYWALGGDTLNPLANRPQDINAQMGALELSYDHDWMRFRVSGLWSSGDHDITNNRATGFDSILDNPNFAGGDFSYWQRQQLRLFGVNLMQQRSLIPDLRSSKLQGQANFVNPGLFLVNAGIDLELTPRWRIVNNANVMWFDAVQPLQQFLYQQHVNRFIGVDLSIGTEYRPFLNNNVIFRAGFASLIPGQGFRDLFNGYDHDARALYAGFLEAVLTY